MVTTKAVDAEPIGTVAVVDLENACDLYGLHELPSPLGRSRPVGSVWLATRSVEPIETRLFDGDLRDVRPYVESLVRAEVCIECRTAYRHDGRLDLRLHGTRAGELTFVALQRRDDDGVDVVDVYSSTPEALGYVVADALELAEAGSQWRITVADGVEGDAADDLPSATEPEDLYDDFGFPIPRTEVAHDGGVVVADGEVVAVGTVRIRRGPTGAGPVGGDREALRWVHVHDDGVYLFEHEESSVAEPLESDTLGSLIEAKVAEDLAAVRERRGRF